MEERISNKRKLTRNPVVIVAIVGALFGFFAAGMQHMPVVYEGIFTSLGSQDDLAAFNERMQSKQLLVKSAVYMAVGAVGLPAMIVIIGLILTSFSIMKDKIKSLTGKGDKAA